MVMYITASEGRLQIEEFLENVRTIGYKDRTVQEIGFVIRKLLSSMDSQTALSEETVISCIHHLKIDRRSVSRYNFFCSSCKKFLNFLYHGDIYFKPALNSELTIDETIQGAHFTDFISQSALNNSLTTKSKKVRAISRFLQALRDTGVNSIEKIKFENISYGFSGLSIEDKYTTLSYLRYLFSINVIPYDFSVLLHIEKRPIKLPSVYSQEEIMKVLEQINLDSEVGSRNKAILLLAARYGLRSCDIVNLKFTNFDFDKKQLKFIQKKTNVDVSTVIDQDLISCLKDYINFHRPQKPSEYIFLNENAPFNLMNTGVIRYMMKKYFLSAEINVGNRKRGPHALRSSLASAMIENDIPYEVVEKKLGHQSLDSISRYVKVSAEKLRQCSLETHIETGNFAIWLNQETL